MKVAVIGSRELRIENVGTYLPKGVTELVSGGARAVTSRRDFLKPSPAGSEAARGS